MKEKLQQFGKAMLVPISLIALSGLLVGLGGALTTELTMTSLGVNWDWYSTSFLFDFFSVIKGLGNVIIGNLGPLYAVGCAFSLSRKEKGWAAFSALICYLAMHNTINVLLDAQGLNAANTTVEALEASGLSVIEASKASALYTIHLGFFTYSMGVLGGIVVGCLVAWITSKFYNTKLPTALSFFAGTRTVPIISLVAGGVLGIFFFFAYPPIGYGLSNLAGFVHDSGLIGTFVYRFSDECLVPFGMHPMLETPMYWTELGGVAMVDGVRVVGNSAIQLAQLASPDTSKILVRSFMGGLGIINWAIYPGAALAMYHCAKPENKKKVAGLMIPAIVSTTCFGVTEPILFTFLFVAPWLYFLVYAPLAALGEVLCEVFQVSIYQGNLKDWIPFFLRPEKINIMPYLWLFPVFFIVSYFLFRFFIIKFDVMTPGRDEDDDEEIRLYTEEDYKNKVAQKNGENSANGNPSENEGIELAKNIVQALGGKENINEVDNCISRLRIVLKDPSKMESDAVFKKKLKAMGVIHMGNAVQIVYGPQVAGIAADVHDVMGI
ncbi:PTS transporter subunit EIIC [Faecalicoccus pleomorphus]|uniref:PTS transporter subunit EIIC n=1 Tax=Faecalicoccus pleomorphus TaxID=1323 RepID=UPI00189A024D|nr:PTS transporter subunit EIIC [Faecalicoccus pleomorphus]MDB7984817.1 PTS transporter subunit EIIC [Faecalicoccus pleomorphus]